MKKVKGIYIGTSGWYYDHWKGPFYPEDLPRSRFLSYYAERLGTVEINNSFYRLPEESTFRAWKDNTPPGFLFSVKASRLITHLKRLKEPERTLPNFLDRIKALGDKLGPVLFQLPPNWHLNPERLKEFAAALPKGLATTFEFRDATWFDEAVYKTLSDYNAAFCIYDLNYVQSPKKTTAHFIYIRLHGPDGSYSGSYSDEALSEWADHFSGWIKKVKAIYCYFDNDQKGYAALNAATLARMIKERKLI